MHHVEHRRAREPSERRRTARRQGERRERQVPEVLERCLGERHEAARRHDARRQRQDENQHDAEPEVRERDAEEPERQGGPVGGAASPRARPGVRAARRSAPRPARRAAVSSIVTGSRSTIMRPIGSFWRKSMPKSPRTTPASQRSVLRRQRLVEVEGLAHRTDALGRRLVAEDHDGRIARDHAHEPEDQHAHAEQQRRGQREPPHHVGQ